MKSTARAKKKKKKRKKKDKATLGPDPWSVCYESVYGGKLSPKEEFEKVKAGALKSEGARAEITRADLKRIGAELAQKEKEASLKKKRNKKCTKKVLPVAPKASDTELEKHAVVGNGGIPLSALLNGFKSEPFFTLSLRSCALKGVSLSIGGCAPTSLVALDLADNDIDSVELGKSWLRCVDLSSNRLVFHERMFSGSASKLLVLNLSSNKLNDLDALASLADTCSQLRCLLVRDCGISKLCAPQDAGKLTQSLTRLQFLQELDVSANLLASTQEATLLCAMKSLVALSLQGNPMCSGTDAYVELCKQLKFSLCKLTNLDGIEVDRMINMNADFVADAAERSTDAMLVDSSSCSCLHGNPCAVSYNCRDWDNRFEVAKQARLKKNYF